MLLQLKNKLQKNSENTVTIKETNKNSRWKRNMSKNLQFHLQKQRWIKHMLLRC